MDEVKQTVKVSFAALLFFTSSKNTESFFEFIDVTRCRLVKVENCRLNLTDWSPRRSGRSTTFLGSIFFVCVSDVNFFSIYRTERTKASPFFPSSYCCYYYYGDHRRRWRVNLMIFFGFHDTMYIINPTGQIFWSLQFHGNTKTYPFKFRNSPPFPPD